MPKPTDNIEVLREDQEKINKFSRLNGQLSEVEQMIESRTKIVKVKTTSERSETKRIIGAFRFAALSSF